MTAARPARAPAPLADHVGGGALALAWALFRRLMVLMLTGGPRRAIAALLDQLEHEALRVVFRELQRLDPAYANRSFEEANLRFVWCGDDLDIVCGEDPLAPTRAIPARPHGDRSAIGLPSPGAASRRFNSGGRVASPPQARRRLAGARLFAQRSAFASARILAPP